MKVRVISRLTHDNGVIVKVAP
ncbi:hypothetical protein MASSI9I_50775 [Massilia sp. 9I]|nr:hypothetical protein MASSI9I_50775 [Massilia sp. 9I]